MGDLTLAQFHALERWIILVAAEQPTLGRPLSDALLRARDAARDALVDPNDPNLIAVQERERLGAQHD